MRSHVGNVPHGRRFHVRSAATGTFNVLRNMSYQHKRKSTVPQRILPRLLLGLRSRCGRVCPQARRAPVRHQSCFCVPRESESAPPHRHHHQLHQLEPLFIYNKQNTLPPRLTGPRRATDARLLSCLVCATDVLGSVPSASHVSPLIRCY